jgi:hypothetical protein
MNISVLQKNILWKSYFYLKDDKDYVGGAFVTKSILYVYQNAI